MIDVIEWTTAFEDAFELAKLAHVATRVERDFDIGAQAEADLISLVWQVAGDDVMTSLAQFGDQTRADRAQSSGD